MRKKNIIIAVISAALALTVILCTLPVLAKYIATRGEQVEINSNHFYFTSDYLMAGEIPVYTVIGNSVSFRLRNYEDLLRVNQSDIAYTVTSDAGNLSMENGTLFQGSADDNAITLTYAFSDAEDQKEITVTATGNASYEKELKAKFILLKPTADLRYEIKDAPGNYYAELYLYTGTAPQTVGLLWDNATLLIDETNDYVFGNVINEPSPTKSHATTKTVTAETAVKILFFKKDKSADYTCPISVSGDGTVTVS